MKRAFRGPRRAVVTLPHKCRRERERAQRKEENSRRVRGSASRSLERSGHVHGTCSLVSANRFTYTCLRAGWDEKKVTQRAEGEEEKKKKLRGREKEQP